MDTINRQAAIKDAESWVAVDEYEKHLQRDVIEWLKKFPPAEPKRIRGKWVGADTQCGIVCSVCGVAVDDFCHSIDYIDLDYEPNFCPNCGADMREVTT